MDRKKEQSPTHLFGAGIVLGIPRGQFANSLIHDEEDSVEEQPLVAPSADVHLVRQAHRHRPLPADTPPISLSARPASTQAAQQAAPQHQQNTGG